MLNEADLNEATDYGPDAALAQAALLRLYAAIESHARQREAAGVSSLPFRDVQRELHHAINEVWPASLPPIAGPRNDALTH